MKKIVTVTAVLSTLLALVLSMLPIYIIAFFPAIIGVVFSFILWKINQKNNAKSKILKVLIIALVVSLSSCTYKVIFTKAIISDPKNSEQQEQKSEKEAIEELEGLEIEE